MTTTNAIRSESMRPATLHAALGERYGLNYLSENVAFAMAIAIYFTRHNDGKWVGNATRGNNGDLVVESEFLQIARAYSPKVDANYLRVLQSEEVILFSGDNMRFSLRRKFFVRCDELLAEPIAAKPPEAVIDSTLSDQERQILQDALAAFGEIPAGAL